jgi:hypothetical protein
VVNDLQFAVFLHLPDAEAELEVVVPVPQGAGDHVVQPALGGVVHLADVLRDPLGGKQRVVPPVGDADGGERLVAGAGGKGLREPQRQSAGEAAERFLRLRGARGGILQPEHRALREGHAPGPAFLAGQQVRREGLEPVEPHRLAEADEADLGLGCRIAGLLLRRLALADEQLGHGVGEAHQARLQLGPVQFKEQVQQVLGGLGVARHEVGLQQVDAGGGAVALGVVARGEQLDELLHVAGAAEVARDRHEHIGPVAGAGQHGLVDRHGARRVLGLQLLAGGGQLGEDAAGGAGFVRAGRSLGLLVGWLAVEESHGQRAKACPPPKRGGFVAPGGFSAVPARAGRRPSVSGRAVPAS